MKFKNILLTGCFFLLSFMAFGQNTVDINPTFRHSVGGIDTLDRAKFINVHADITEGDWTSGNNLGNFADLRDEFLNGYDVYMGRNTGGITWQLGQMNEDPDRPGFADPEHIAQRGQNVRNNYANNTAWHPYEARNDLIIAAQHHPFFPDGTLTGQGWALASAEATGEYMGRYVNEFHGGNGQPLPAWIEVMNEPLWEFTTNGPYSPAEVFQFHNDAADAIRAQGVTVPIGGYCTAFPLFEQDNFQRWNDRWKLFMDMSGDYMDYWTIHLYDFNSIAGGQKRLRRGGNNEATFDMMEHYSHLLFGEAKPFLISEFGGRALELEPNPWTPYRDWMTIKSFSSMWLTFMERPDLMLKTIPFIIVKAEWGTNPQTGAPYPWRLMRRANEAPGETGNHWVYTEMVKLFQQWSDVRGTRVDTRSQNPDVQSIAFVDGNKLHLVLVNLNFENTTVDLNLAAMAGNTVENIKVKYLYLSGDAPVLEETNYTDLTSFDLEPEATAVIEYTFENPIDIDQSSSEVKYYAEEHLTPIAAFAEQKFHINGVAKPQFGEATLRIGFGRDHGKSLTPTVKVNGQEIHVPEGYSGDDQSQRDRWFGLKEIRIPWAHLREDNEISVQFDDASGHISSMSMRVFEMSEPLARSTDEAVQGISLTPGFKQLEVGNEFHFLATISPLSAANHAVTWESDDETVATVDEFGNVTAEGLGTATIMVTTEDGGLMATATVEVVSDVLPVAVTGFQLSPETFELSLEEQLLMQPTFTPADATNQNVTWQSMDENVATVDATGLVTGVGIGEAQIIGTTEDGGLTDTSIITVFANYENAVFCQLIPSEFESTIEMDFQVEYTAAEAFDIAVEIKNANNVWVGEGQVTVEPGIGTATVPVTFRELSTWIPTAPAPGAGYTVFAWIRAVGGNWTTNNGNCAVNNATITGPNATATPIEGSGISIFPNPTSGIFQIELPLETSEANVTVSNILGATVLQQPVGGVNSTIDLSHTASGIYMVQVETEGNIFVQQIVKE